GETATKSGAPTLETPYTVNIVSRELLDLRNVSNIGEAAETISGVQRTIGFSGNQRFRIRGFQNISTLRDGFRQSVSQPEIDLQGVESIEVLKGPASALYGRFEPGGVINFVSKRPYSEVGGEAFV
ncbi:TonB-dependent receptor plug domain-containing protein, partial [Acinetobacter baumannii]